MSGPIQILPPGLLGFLQIKNAGQNPGELGPVLAPVLELRDWYFQARMLDALNLFGANETINAAVGANFFATYVVPAHAWLYVDSFNLTAALLAADYIRFAPILYTFPGIPGQSQLQFGPDVNDVISARARSICAGTTRGFFAPPGSQFGFRVFDMVTAGNIAVTGQLKAALLPV